MAGSSDLAKGKSRQRRWTATTKLHRRSVPQILQMEVTECGAACLAMVLGYYGYKTSVGELNRRCGVGRDGLSALTVVKAARNYGLRARGIALKEADFRFVKLPAILHWEFNHFVVLERWSPKRVWIVDPAQGRRQLSPAEFETSFTGVVIELEPGAQFERHNEKTGFSPLTYLKYLRQMPGVAAQVLAVSLLLQFFGLGLPVLTKLIVDEILPHGLDNLLGLVGIGMVLLALLQLVSTLLRASLLVYLQARIDSQLMVGFFEHLLALPYRFFQQRSSGDLLSRAASNAAIREILTGQLLSVGLDSTLVGVYLLILLWQAPGFGGLALALGLVQISLVWLTGKPMNQLTRRDLMAQGKAQGYLVESLIGIETLKSAGAEQWALEHWTNLFYEQLNLSIRRNYLGAVINTAMSTLRLLAPLVLLWVGAGQVLAGTLTVGTMFALNALALAFLTPLTSLVDNGQKIQLVQGHFDRVADIMGAAPEQLTQTVEEAPRLSGAIELQNVSFRYDPNAPLVLENIKLKIQPGQKVALVGRTGSGKSTLARLLLGLYLPTQGQILYDGKPLQSLDYQSVRRQFGIVLQEAFLFNGTIRQNIAFNRPDLPLETVIQAARQAGIDEDINQMPMGYETFVSEGGSALSGGQRQRLAIARALAHTPAILLLDEATSSLDVLTEQVVDQNLNHLECTRIVIAHRLSTIRNADLILVLDQGQIVEQGSHAELLARGGYYSRLIKSQLDSN